MNKMYSTLKTFLDSGHATDTTEQIYYEDFSLGWKINSRPFMEPRVQSLVFDLGQINPVHTVPPHDPKWNFMFLRRSCVILRRWPTFQRCVVSPPWLKTCTRLHGAIYQKAVIFISPPQRSIFILFFHSSLSETRKQEKVSARDFCIS